MAQTPFLPEERLALPWRAAMVWKVAGLIGILAFGIIALEEITRFKVKFPVENGPSFSLIVSQIQSKSFKYQIDFSNRPNNNLAEVPTISDHFPIITYLGPSKFLNYWNVFPRSDSRHSGLVLSASDHDQTPSEYGDHDSSDGAYQPVMLVKNVNDPPPDWLGLLILAGYFAFPFLVGSIADHYADVNPGGVVERVGYFWLFAWLASLIALIVVTPIVLGLSWSS